MATEFNLLTVDLEEWFVVEALAGRYHPDDWTELPSTLEKNTIRLLKLFQRFDVRATFFVLGYAAEKFPDLIAEIYANGHEVACHSYGHRRVDSLDAEAFQLDTRRAMNAIIKACGARPLGYRAPSWSINDSVPWAFEVLSDLGFEYDSSIFPIKHDLYGMPKGPREMFRMKLGEGRFLYEIPASTYRLLWWNLPMAGGGYLRHCPYWYSRRQIERLNRQGRPAVVYLHPWEIDPDPPPVSGLSATQRLRMYGSTAILMIKLERLLRDFRFTTVLHYIQRRRQRKIGFR
jgi:polysaccharide deacetylase family protein (PEP-CTERM system associated)